MNRKNFKDFQIRIRTLRFFLFHLLLFIIILKLDFLNLKIICFKHFKIFLVYIIVILIIFVCVCLCVSEILDSKFFIQIGTKICACECGSYFKKKEKNK